MLLYDLTGSSIITDSEKAKVCCDAFVAKFRSDAANTTFVPFQAGFEVNVTYAVVASYLSKLKAIAVRVGLKYIPNIFMRYNTQKFLVPLITIHQRSVFDSHLPDAWSIAKVVPLYIGKGDKTNPNSYRPISLTS